MIVQYQQRAGDETILQDEIHEGHREGKKMTVIKKKKKVNAVSNPPILYSLGAERGKTYPEKQIPAETQTLREIRSLKCPSLLAKILPDLSEVIAKAPKSPRNAG